MTVGSIETRKRRSLVGQFFWLLKYRPAEVYQLTRGYVLFQWSRFARNLPSWNSETVVLGENVRLQKNTSVRAEAPHARISIGSHSIVYEDSRIESYGSSQVSIGECSVLGGVRISSRHKVTIGDRFLASWNIFIQDYDSHPPSPAKRAEQVRKLAALFRPRFGNKVPQYDEVMATWDFPGEEISIGDDVWLGANTTVLKGARIGSGSIVAAGSVVIKGEYPPKSLIAGNPAKAVKALEE